MTILNVLLLTFVGQACIFIGLMFIAGKFLPATLAPLYEVIPVWGRLAIMVVIFSTPANFLFSKAYTIAPASFVGAVYLASVVLATVVVALLVDGARLNVQIAAATSLTLVGAVWAAYAIKAATP